MALFDVVEQYGEEYIKVKALNKHLMFSWISDLNKFIKSRKAPKHRKHIDKLMRICGCNNLIGFLDVTHALSLNDTFWVKRANDKKLCWDKVSLYNKGFNETIAKIAFDGGLYGENFSSTSPEFGTDGTFAKCWIKERGTIKLLKRGSEGACNSGLEPYSEFYATQILDELGIKHVSYNLGKKHGSLVSKCDLFTSEDYGLVTVGKYTNRISSINDLVNFYKELGCLNYLSEMIVADSIIFNEDRHLGNLGFIFDNNTGNIVDTAPLYDHNLSLLCYATNNDFKDIRGYIKDKDKGHRLGGRSFEAVGKAFMTPNMRRKLINMRDFKFTRHNKYNLPAWRIEALEKLVQSQVRLLIEN